MLGWHDAILAMAATQERREEEELDGQMADRQDRLTLGIGKWMDGWMDGFYLIVVGMAFFSSVLLLYLRLRQSLYKKSITESGTPSPVKM